MTTTTYYKRIETVVVDDRVFARGIVNAVEHTAYWVTLAVAMPGGEEKVRAPKGTLIEAQYPETMPSDDVVAVCGSAAYAALANRKGDYGHDGSIAWGDLAKADVAAFERLVLDVLLGKQRPARDDDERQTLEMVDTVIVAVARSRGWKGR